MGENVKLVCETCLSSERRLFATSRIHSILTELHCKELDSKVICWECHAIIMKFYNFQIQARNAQIALHVKNFKTLSNLVHSTKQTYDSEFVYNEDFFPNNTNKEEKSEIKYEKDCDTGDLGLVHSDSEDDKKLTVFVDTLETSKEILPKKKRSFPKQISDEKKKKVLSPKKKEIDSAVLKEKFQTVLLTEEEMLRSREEKRSHPNYKKIPYKCDLCVLGFTKKENYDLHFAKKHDEAIGPHVCTVCSTRHASAVSLARHRSLHYTHYCCSLCSYKSTAATAAANHSRAKHALDERDRIHCKNCDAVFRSSEELTKHTQSEHRLCCEECGDNFKRKNTLRAHRVRIHAIKREFTCEVCKRSFTSKPRLESHMAKHSQTLAQRLAYCAVCKVQYKNIQVYRSHVQNSAKHAQIRYPCRECSKKFVSKIYRARHYKFYHLHQSTFKCETCNKLFISQWRLKNHRQKHHGLARTRDYECGECGKKFYSSTTLTTHRATHSVVRSHLCSWCGAQYRQPAALYIHERRAHADSLADELGDLKRKNKK